jgi:hypothetical protein
VTLTHTRCPGARGRGAEHDLVALVGPGGAGIAAQFDLVGRRASGLAGPGKLRGAHRGLRCEELPVSLRGLPGRMVPDRDQETDLYRVRTSCCACFRMMLLL